MHVKGLKEGGTVLSDIGMTVPFDVIVEIPHNLARRSKALQAAMDAGHVHPAPTKAVQDKIRSTPRAVSPRVSPPSKKGFDPKQQIAELTRIVGVLSKRVAVLEDGKDALKSKISSLESTVEGLKAPKKAAKKKTTKKKATKATKTGEE